MAEYVQSASAIHATLTDTIAALRAYLDSIETTPASAPRTLRIIQPTATTKP